MARQDSPLARPRDNSSRSSTLNSRRERWGVGGGMPPVAFTTRRTFSRSKPMWRSIVGTGSPRPRRLQTSALSASVMADFLVIVPLRHGATRSPIYRGGALTPRNRSDYLAFSGPKCDVSSDYRAARQTKEDEIGAA